MVSRMCNLRPWRENNEKCQKLFEEIMIKNFPKLKEDNKPQVQEAQNAPNWVYKNKNTPGHINFIQLKIENF